MRPAHVETRLALMEAERREFRGAWAGLVWELTYILRLDQLVAWLDSKLGGR